MIIKLTQGSHLINEFQVLNEDIINGAEIFIGREDDCHIILNSHKVSRYHASVQIDQNKLMFKVLSDYGGVTFNGVNINNQEVKESDAFKIFDYEVEFSDVDLGLNETPALEETPVAVEEPEDFTGSDLLSDVVSSEAEAQVEDDFLADVPGAAGLDEYNELADNDTLDESLGQTEVLADELMDNDNNATEILADDMNATEIMAEEPAGEINEFNEFREENYDDDFMNQDFSVEDSEEESNNEPVSTGDDLTDLEAGVEDYSTSVDHENLSDDNFDFGNNQNAEGGFENQDDSFNDGFGDGFSDGDGFDDGFGDDAGGFGGDEGSATQVISSFANYYLEILGEYAPFDRFQITETETFIGRDPEKCQIILDDPEVSKIHATIKKSIIGCVLEDANSSNGIIFNGERVNKAELSNGDEFLIGDTSFTVAISSDIIEVEKDRLMPVEDNQEVEIEEIVEEEVDYDNFGGEGAEFGAEKEKSLIKRIWKDKRKRLYLIVGVFVLALVVLLGDEPTIKEDRKEVTEAPKKEEVKDQTKFSPEVLEKLEQNYTLALAKSDAGEYYEAKEYIDIVMQIDENYKDGNAKILNKLIQEGYEKLVKLEEEEQARKERLERQAKIADLLKKATKAVDERNALSARKFFGMILELDPENPDVTPLKIDLDAWEAEEKRKKQEASLAEARRKAMVDKLSPGKTLYLRQDWYKAIDRLEKFLKEEGMDEDLIKEATQMLQESKANLNDQISPLLSKARSFKEGQDLKQAYETYDEVLRFEPSNEEALNQKSEIYSLLLNRSKKVYREALVAESLSLFNKAKEKFQEVQQISPVNSKYYLKATEKLENYLE